MPPREYVFIMDVSGSQMGFPIEVSKVLMQGMIQGLRPQDLFNVMVFEGSSALWAPESRPATPENTQQALAFVRQQSGGGGTELGSALRRALTLPRVPGVSRSFVVSTDGYISADGSVFDIIRQHLGDANLFAFGIGSSVNRHLIEGMAHAGQGEPFVVMNQEQASAEAERFRTYVSAPALSSVKVAYDGFQAYDVEPQQLPDVLAERPVLCFGKWKGEAKGSITVSGMTGGGAWSQTFDVGASAASASQPALRQLWARERIRTLSDYDQFGADEARKQETIRLGLAYHLLTAHTSFVAVDTEARNEGGQSSTVVQPLPMPQGVSDAAIGGSMGMVHQAPMSAPSRGYLGALSGQGVRAKASMAQGAGASADALKEEKQVWNAPAKPAPPPPLPPAQVKALACDQPGLKLTALRAELEAKLRNPALAHLLSNLPKGAVLTLQVDASGHVASAAFDQAFSGSTRALALIKGWRLKAWTAQLPAQLKATLG
jgi:Ca-activated chloride channel family protein